MIFDFRRPPSRSYVSSRCAAVPPRHPAAFPSPRRGRVPASAGGNGAGYMKITNNGTEADVLPGGSSDAAERVEVHETTIDDKGVASMKKLDAVELKSGQSIELKPAGMHVMLIGLKQPLKEGDSAQGEAEVQEGRQGRRRIRCESRRLAPRLAATMHHQH